MIGTIEDVGGRMNLRNLFAVNIIFALSFGLSCALFTQWVFSLYGITADDPSFWAPRLLGGSILGSSILNGGKEYRKLC
jgi:hypothetical protein